jgi:DNA-binding response OmpR family regulator
MKPMKLLIIEDDPDIRDFIGDGFKSEGYTVDLAAQGDQGSYLARVNDYDAIILDYSLPLKNGLEVCDEVRASGIGTPILFLSVISDTQTKIAALSKGADDYLTKPFFFDELRERIKALLRRPRKITDSTMTRGELVLDTEKRTVERAGKPIYLTRKEYSLLEYLMRNAEMAVSRSMILEHVWNADSDPFSNTVEAHIMRLRRKINTGFDTELIKNIPGRGYVIEP